MSQSKKKAAGAYKAPLTLLYAGIAAQAFGIAALALVSRRVLDEGGSPWGWVLLFLALALPLLDGGLDLLSGRTVDRAAVSLRRDTLDTLLSKDAEAYSRYHSGQVFSRLTQDAYTVCEWRVVGRPQVAGQLIRLLCAASALFFVNIPLALAVVGAGALAIAGGRLLRKYLTRRHLRVRQAEEGLTGCTQEILEHTELLRSMTAGEEAVRRFEGRQKEWLRERKRLRVFSTGVGTGFSAVLQLGYAVLLVWGDIANPGYVDIPDEATTIREAIYGIGGGIPNGKKFKAVQIGGPSGGLLVEEHLDLPLHFQKLKPYGVRRGDSVITVLDEDRCMVDVACRFMQYTQTEFCGKCVPCREGTKRMNELLWAMRDYRLSESDFHMLTDLGEMISVTAFCNLGRNSYHTLETAIKYFPEEFKDHLRGDCALCELDREPIEPGGLPYNRIRLEIDPSICRGCSKCSRSCHAEAITGVIKSPFVIDPEKCVKCYTCIEACPFDAIQEVEIDG